MFVKYSVLVGVLALLSISIIPIMAQESESLIQIKTEDGTYEEGNTIVISGNVSTVVVGDEIILQIIYDGAEKMVVEIAQIRVARDGSYSHTVIAEGPQWQNDGSYVVKAFYGGHDGETTFEYTTEKGIAESKDNYEVDAGSRGTFDVEYTIKGGDVKNMIVDPNIFGMRIQVNVTDDGSITLDLPRQFIGAENQDGKDIGFIILINEINASYEELVVHSDSRIITINFEPGDTEIQIIGTYVVPEFGTIAAMILAVAIIPIIIASKNKIQIKV